MRPGAACGDRVDTLSVQSCQARVGSGGQPRPYGVLGPISIGHRFAPSALLVNAAKNAGGDAAGPRVHLDRSPREPRVDKHTPAFMIRRPALVSLKRQASAAAQPTQLPPPGRTEDDVPVEHREVDWQDDREAISHVPDAADDRPLANAWGGRIRWTSLSSSSPTGSPRNGYTAKDHP